MSEHEEGYDAALADVETLVRASMEGEDNLSALDAYEDVLRLVEELKEGDDE